MIQNIRGQRRWVGWIFYGYLISFLIFPVLYFRSPGHKDLFWIVSGMASGYFLIPFSIAFAVMTAGYMKNDRRPMAWLILGVQGLIVMVLPLGLFFENLAKFIRIWREANLL